VGARGTTAAREQFVLPFIGLQSQDAHRTATAVDSDRSGFLPYGPLVNDWLAFLAERLTAEFLRDVEPKP
jgi:hypothetical protein